MLQRRMIFALLMALQLVQAGDYVRFDLCFLDYSKHDWEFRPHPQGHWASIRRGNIEGYTDARLGLSKTTGGIDCSRIYTRGGTFFVIGSPRQICERLGGKECQ